MNNYIFLAFLFVVLALPYVVYRRERKPAETITEWFNRNGNPPFADLHRALLESRWIRPGWLLRYSIELARVSYVIAWISALFIFVIGVLFKAHFGNVGFRLARSVKN